MLKLMVTEIIGRKYLEGANESSRDHRQQPVGFMDYLQ